MLKILACTPMYSGIDPLPAYCMRMLWQRIGAEMEKGRYKVKDMVIGPRVPIRVARNLLCHTAIKAGADRLLMIDDDICYKPDLLDILLAADKDIVGGLCFNAKSKPCFFVDDGAGNLIADPEPPRHGLKQGFAIGTGAMLIKTEVLREMAAPWFYYEKDDNTMDVKFCTDARRKGFEVWCSGDALLRHMVHGAYSSRLPWDEQEGLERLDELNWNDCSRPIACDEPETELAAYSASAAQR